MDNGNGFCGHERIKCAISEVGEGFAISEVGSAERAS